MEIRNLWEKKDLQQDIPPRRIYLDGTQDPRVNPNLHWLVVDEPMLKDDIAKEPLHGEGHDEDADPSQRGNAKIKSSRGVLRLWTPHCFDNFKYFR